MRLAISIVATTILLLAMPAVAGNYNLDKKGGSWKSTKCASPLAPPAIKKLKKEPTANELNGQVLKYNQYLEDAQAYMYCLSQEAQDDVVISGQVIVHTAQAMIDQLVAEVNAMPPVAPAAERTAKKGTVAIEAPAATPQEDPFSARVDRPPVSRQTWKKKAPQAQD